MFHKENPAPLRILEIYSNKESDEAHLKIPHFLTYKTSPLKMVKSLRLLDMDALDSKTMPTLIRKYE